MRRFVGIVGGLALLLTVACPAIAGDAWLDEVVFFDQPPGSSDEGGPPEGGLGSFDGDIVSIDIPERAIFAFTDNTAVDGPGNDLYIYEEVNGDSSVLVYASKDNRNYVYLGKPNGDAAYDLANYGLDYVTFIKFVGLDDAGASQGYDLDAVQALNSGPPPGEPALSGCVSLGGRPVPGAKVIVKQKREPKQTTTTDASGWYEIWNLVPGKKTKVRIRGILPE